MYSIAHLKSLIAHFSQRLDQKGFVANHDGNITVKIAAGFLATPTSMAKAAITEDQILTLDEAGKKIDGLGEPFSEIKIHLAAYRARPDALAVVHAHPPFATAAGLVGLEIRPRLPEAVVSLGHRIPITPLTLPGTKESESTVEQALTIADVCMIPGNGVLAIGDNVEQAYLRLELVEHLAKMDYYANHWGAPLELPATDVQKLLEKRKAAGLGPQARNIAPPTTHNTTHSAKPKSDLEKMIAEEIRKALQG